MKARNWLRGWILIVGVAFCFISYYVYKVDPYFHYHKPDTDRYYYSLKNQRYINFGIVSHFDYDAVITGTSMTENFKTTEMDKIFGCHSIKVPFSGASFKEIDDNLQVALASNPNLKVIVRGLDARRLGDAWDTMRNDLGVYPTYLFDNNPFTDVNYLLNKDVVFGRVYKMVQSTKEEGFKGGIDSFDSYSSSQETSSFGRKAVYASESKANFIGGSTLTEEDKLRIKENIEKNVTDTPDKYPDVAFYYFYTPYSIAKWAEYDSNGTLISFMDAMAYATELIISHKNIHLYLFNNRTDIITDLNHYKDASHYAGWINSLMLKWMHDGDYLLTEENYRECLQKQYDFYTTFDYTSFENQEDYEADYYAAALLNQELTGAKPIDLLNSKKTDVVLNKAKYIKNGKKLTGISCSYGLPDNKDAGAFASYVCDGKYIAAKCSVNIDETYHYLTFYAQKDKAFGSAYAYVYNENGDILHVYEMNASDSKQHQYCFSLAEKNGTVTIVFACTVPKNLDTRESECTFSDLYLY